jgi:hypothetical protein
LNNKDTIPRNTMNTKDTMNTNEYHEYQGYHEYPWFPLRTVTIQHEIHSTKKKTMCVCADVLEVPRNIKQRCRGAQNGTMVNLTAR